MRIYLEVVVQDTLNNHHLVCDCSTSDKKQTYHGNINRTEDHQFEEILNKKNECPNIHFLMLC